MINRACDDLQVEAAANEWEQPFSIVGRDEFRCGGVGDQASLIFLREGACGIEERQAVTRDHSDLRDDVFGADPDKNVAPRGGKFFIPDL